MKKFLFALIFIALFSGSVYAENLKIGELAKLNMTPEDLQKINSQIPASKSQAYRNYDALNGEYKFYDSLNTMLLALNKGEIDRVILPEDVAKYVLNNTKDFQVNSIVKLKREHYFSFGFHDDENGRKLRKIFNDALFTLKNSGRLSVLKEKYIAEMGEFKPLEFAKFDGADTIKVAVTGDLPPVDYTAEDGAPAGFNIAVLAECAKLAKINLEIVSIDAKARAAALVSGRVNLVFWFQSREKEKQSWDVPEGVILSEPYYNYDELYLLELRKNK